MIELFKRARWDQAYDFLTYGDPPMIARLLANFLILFQRDIMRIIDRVI